MRKEQQIKNGKVKMCEICAVGNACIKKKNKSHRSKKSSFPKFFLQKLMNAKM